MSSTEDRSDAGVESSGGSAPQARPPLGDPPPVRRLPRGLTVVLGAALIASAGMAVAARYRGVTEPRPHERATNLRPQTTLPEPAPKPLPEVGTAPLVLTYHDIDPGATGPYNVKPERFAQDMASMHAAGWRTASATDYLAWVVDGTPLPSKSFVITFDDGTAGAWRYAEPVLARYDAHAILFVVTGWVGDGDYYLRWPEIHALAATGRWAIASHSHLAHTFVPIDAARHEQPALINRAWLGDALETPDAFRERIRSDLRLSVRTLERRGFPRPTLFAYPYGAAETPTNDPRAAEVAREEIARRFTAAMAENVRSVTGARPDPYAIPRIGISSKVSLAQLLTRQARAERQGAAALQLEQCRTVGSGSCPGRDAA